MILSAGAGVLQKNDLAFGGSLRRKHSVSLCDNMNRLAWELKVEGHIDPEIELSDSVEKYLLKFNIPIEVSRLMQGIRMAMPTISRERHDLPDEFIEAIPVGARLGKFHLKFKAGLFHWPTVGILANLDSIAEDTRQKLVDIGEYYYLMSLDDDKKSPEDVKVCDALRAKFKEKNNLVWEYHTINLVLLRGASFRSGINTERPHVLKTMLLTLLKQELVQSSPAIKMR